MPEYNDISAGGQSRQHNGDNFNYSTNYYPLRQKRSDDKLRENARNRALLQAAAEGQTVRVNKLLRDGADVDFVDKYEWTALHHAAYSGFEDTVQDLLAAGADVNARSQHFGTPLALAAIKSRFNVVKRLSESRASVSTPCGKLGSVLHAACAAGHIHLIEFLLDLGADWKRKERFEKTVIDRLLEPQDVGNYLDFHNVLEKESEYSPEYPDDGEHGALCFDYDNDIFLHEEQYTSAMNLAALCGNGDALAFMVRYMVEHSNMKMVDMDTIENTLCYTAAYSQTAPLGAFLSYFDGLIELNSYRGSRAVIAAAYTGNIDCLQHLLEQGASAHPNEDEEMNALLMAARRGHTKCIELLTEHDHPDKDWANFESNAATPLMEAASGGHLESVRALLRKGASVEPPHGSGKNALHCAAEYGHVPIIEDLVKAGIEVNSLDHYKWTPLMCSLFVQEWGIGEVFRPRQYVIAKLIALGANPTINDIAQVLTEHDRKDALPWLERKIYIREAADQTSSYVADQPLVQRHLEETATGKATERLRVEESERQDPAPFTIREHRPLPVIVRESRDPLPIIIRERREPQYEFIERREVEQEQQQQDEDHFYERRVIERERGASEQGT